MRTVFSDARERNVKGSEKPFHPFPSYCLTTFTWFTSLANFSEKLRMFLRIHLLLYGMIWRFKSSTSSNSILTRKGKKASWLDGNCIKIGLPGKSILRDYFQENRTSRRSFLLLRISFPGRPIFIQLPPGWLLTIIRLVRRHYFLGRIV